MIDTDIMCHLWKMLETDTFTYTFSQLFLDKLFIIMGKLADAADLKGGSVLLICPFIIETKSDSRARAWRNGIRSGLKEKLSARLGNRRCRTAQIRGTLKWQSRAKPGADTSREGVETRRAAPKLRGFRGRVEG